jgi:hypothetical protein
MVRQGPQLQLFLDKKAREQGSDKWPNNDSRGRKGREHVDKGGGVLEDLQEKMRRHTAA